jgi:hypothetical protein
MGAGYTVGATWGMAEGTFGSRDLPRKWHNTMSKILFYLQTLHGSGAA